MKRYILLFLLLPIFGLSQRDNSFNYSEAQEVPGTKHELYLKAYKWVTAKIGSLSAIKVADSTLGKISMYANFTVKLDRIHLFLDIDVKDNKARIKTNQYYYEQIGMPFPLEGSFPNKSKRKQLWWNNLKEESIKFTDNLYESFFKAMKAEDNW